MDELKPATSLPWHVEPLSLLLRFGRKSSGTWNECEADCPTDHDAEYIVHACNSYPALSAENARLKEIIRAVNDQLVGYDDYHTVEVGFVRAAIRSQPSEGEK